MTQVAQKNQNRIDQMRVVMKAKMNSLVILEFGKLKLYPIDREDAVKLIEDNVSTYATRDGDNALIADVETLKAVLLIEAGRERLIAEMEGLEF